MNPEEKTVLLGALFHDIGKFGQCCSGSMAESHTKIGVELLESFKEEILPLLDGSENYFKKLCDLVADHHDHQGLLYLADRISAGEGIDNEIETEKSSSKSFPFLSSVFSSVRLSSKNEVPPQFYGQSRLDSGQTETLTSISGNSTKLTGYNNESYNQFKSELRTILSSYGSIGDFSSVVSLILKFLESWLWCLPDYTDSSISDISLYNHLRDTAGFVHAIHRTKVVNPESKELILIVGDLPGKQKYVVNVLNKKPANYLRGRAIFLQTLSHVFSGIFIKNFDLTEASMIMNTGGKFYILAPGTDDFEVIYQNTITEIDNLLSTNFDYDLSFASGYTKFDYYRLAQGEFGIGKVIDDAAFNLNNGRNRMFESLLFADFDEKKFVIDVEYTSPMEGTVGTDSVKCAVTNSPIKRGRDREIEDEHDLFSVDLQVQNEFNIGKSDPQKPLVCSIKKTRHNFDLIKAELLDDFQEDDTAVKVIINSSMKELIDQLQQKKPDEVFRLFNNTSYIGLADYASIGEKSDAAGSIMSFKEMAESCKGAELLTLIKGDVDNLGLIMSTGLDHKASVSQTTTMSNHLKHFFSTNLNDLLENKCGAGDKRAYTVYAGDDDFMLITTQSYSLDLLKEINDKFNQLVCNNPEIHISYSVTNFKHSTPVKFVAGFAEDSLNQIKKNFKNPGLSKCIEEDSFLKFNDKSGVIIFETAMKSDKIGEFIGWADRIVRWIHLSPRPPFTMDAIRYIFKISKMMSEYYEKKNSAALIWHPRLTYYIRKNLSVSYQFEDAHEEDYYKKFLSQILRIEKDDDFDLKSILHPLMNSVILRVKN